MKTISCPPDCVHLEGEKYQQDKRHAEACKAGERLLEFTQRLDEYEHRGLFEFGLLVQADLYVFQNEYGVLPDLELASALDQFVARHGAVIVPGNLLPPLTVYLLDRFENSARYRMPKMLDASDRVDVVRELARRIRSLGRDESTKHYDMDREFYEHVDMETDFHFDADDLAVLRGESNDGGDGGDGGENFERTAGGLILPK